MADYQAPLADMMFTLEHVSDLAGLAALPGYEHAEPDVVHDLLAEAGRFASEVLSPLNPVGDQQGAKLDNGVVSMPEGFKEAYAQFTEAGWGGVGQSETYGGAGLPYTVSAVITEMLASANLSFGLCPALGDGAMEALEHHASPELRDLFLPALVAGRFTATMDLTEPQAGSDLGAIRTTATPAGDGTHRIRGQKVFITFGDHDLAENIVHLVLARTPDAPAGSRGISCFIVPKFLVNADGSLGERNDLGVVSIEHKMGIHASPTCVMTYGENDACVGYLIGEENQGLRYMFTMMNRERIFVGLQGLGIAERAYQAASAYARERRQGRAVGREASSGDASAIIDHIDVRRMLMEMRASIEAMRCLLYLSASENDRSMRHPDEAERARASAAVALITPVTKAWLTDLGNHVTSLGIQVHGGVGFIEETGVSQYFRDARITPIYEGTNGIQAMDLVLRKIGMQNGAVLRAHLERLRGMAAEVEGAGDELADTARHLGDAIGALERASQWLLEKLASDQRSAAAGATPYLEMMGLVTGGALLARCAAEATKLRGAGENARFLESKISTARFFASQILPRAASLVPSVTAGADPLDALHAEDF